MVEEFITKTPCELTITSKMWDQLYTHLFPGDQDEHGAVILAGLVETPKGIRLLARELHIAVDGKDYVQGKFGYRMLTPRFVRDCILEARDKKLAYLAIHCHGGIDRVEFSEIDLKSHQRGYPALQDVSRNQQMIGGIVFAKNAVAGDIWLPSNQRIPLKKVTVVGRPVRNIYNEQPNQAQSDITYDRQTRLLGDRGQELLRKQKVGIIGAGGVGSLLVEYLARLGVGHLVVIDPDRIEDTNLPRVVGSTDFDALTLATSDSRPHWLRKFAKRLTTPKVHISKRVALQANRSIKFEAVMGSVVDDHIAQKLIDCDYLFLAADTMQSRLVFNAIINQYLIPGVQSGAKVSVDKDSGNLTEVFSVIRPLIPGAGCLWCNGLISSSVLQEEALTEEQRQKQKYIDDPLVKAPSVITLNAVAASHAVDDFLFTVTGLLHDNTEHHWLRFFPVKSDFDTIILNNDPKCSECSNVSIGRLGYGQVRRLPTRLPK